MDDRSWPELAHSSSPGIKQVKAVGYVRPERLNKMKEMIRYLQFLQESQAHRALSFSLIK